MSDMIQAVEGTLDAEDRRRQSAVSTAQVAQATRIRPNLNGAEDPSEPLYCSLPTSNMKKVRSA